MCNSCLFGQTCSSPTTPDSVTNTDHSLPLPTPSFSLLYTLLKYCFHPKSPSINLLKFFVGTLCEPNLIAEHPSIEP